MLLEGKKKLFFNEADIQSIDAIPQGTWLVQYSQQKGFYLEKIEDFRLPSKIYGNHKELSERYLKTYNKYSKNLGITLSGLKGTGKSLLAKMTAINSNLPVLVVTDAYCGTEFNMFMSKISQEVVVFIDEFEKVYDEEHLQNALLSLLDGTIEGKKLFIFTSNQTSRYNNYLLNRPGRIHYLKEFDKIDSKLLDDIINDNLKDMSQTNELKRIVELIDDANVDMIMALIREMNDFNEPAKEAVKYLNIQVQNEGRYNLTVSKKINGYLYDSYHELSSPYNTGKISANLHLSEENVKIKLISNDKYLKMLNEEDRETYYKVRYLLEDLEQLASNRSNVSKFKCKKSGDIIFLEKIVKYSYVF